MIPLSLVFAVLLVVAAFALVNWALPAEDAKMLKSLFSVAIGTSASGVSVLNGWGFVKRSLDLTNAKVQSFHFNDEDARQRLFDREPDRFDPRFYDGRDAVEEDENSSILETTQEFLESQFSKQAAGRDDSPLT